MLVTKLCTDSHKPRLLEEVGKCPGYETHLSSVSAVQEEVHSLWRAVWRQVRRGGLMPSYNLILWPLLSLPYCKQHEAGKSLGTRLVSVSEEISSLHTRSHAHTGRVHCPTCNRCDSPNHSCDTRYVLLAVFVHSDSSRHKVSFHLASLCPLTPPLVPPLLSTDPPSGVTSVGH